MRRMVRTHKRVRTFIRIVCSACAMCTDNDGVYKSTYFSSFAPYYVTPYLTSTSLI